MSTDQILFGVGLTLALAVGSQVLASRLRFHAVTASHRGSVAHGVGQFLASVGAGLVARSIRRVAPGRAVLLIEHRPELAAMADRVVRIDGGRAVGGSGGLKSEELAVR